MADASTVSLSLPPPNAIGAPPRSSGCIEMFGLCGAGKSTITNHLAPVLRQCGQSPGVARPIDPGGIRTVNEAIWLALRTAVTNPASVGPRLFRRQVGALFLKLGLRLASMKIRQAPHGTFLIDSGIMQPFVSYYIEQNLLGLNVPLPALLSVVPFPAAAVYVRTEPELAYRRYVARQREIGGSLNEQGLRGRFDDGFALCEWLHEYCTAVKLPTLVIDSSEPLGPDQLENLAEWFKNVVSSQ